jgi:hypothetical protein
MKPDKVPLELTDKCYCYEKDGQGVVAGFWHKMEVNTEELHCNKAEGSQWPSLMSSVSF